MSKPVAVRKPTGAEVKRPNPKAFFVHIYQSGTQAAFVDPTAPLTCGCWVVVRLDQDYLMGTVVSKHPERCKTITVQIGKGTLRGNPREDVIKIVSIHTDV